MSSDIPTDDFWQEKSLEQLAREQGLAQQRPVDQLIGRGRDLWDSDSQLEQFLADIHERRHETSTT
jgi:hypothetical protein